MKKGKLIVYAGPSGVGKGTIREMFFNKPELNLYWSVSATSRPPRPNEIDGVHYHFISEEKFDQWVKEDKFLEHAEFVGNKYGTPKDFVEEKLNAGHNVFVEIELLGVKQIIKKMPEAVTIFLIPPSIEDLKNRLKARGTEAEDTIERRIGRAEVELADKDIFKHVVINDDINRAAKEVETIILNEVQGNFDEDKGDENV